MDDDLRDRLHRKPFEPFRLVMANGERIDIPAPACLGLHGERIFVGYDYDPADDIPEYGAMRWREPGGGSRADDGGPRRPGGGLTR